MLRRPTLLVLVLAVELGTACGARSGLDVLTRDAGPMGTALDASDADPDRDCPPAPREGAACTLAPVRSCPDCPEGTRICFYPDGPGLTGCTCASSQWRCEPARCDGWGGDCTGSVRDDACSGGLGCGACCSLDGEPSLATWCDCVFHERPFCHTDVVCTGP